MRSRMRQFWRWTNSPDCAFVWCAENATCYQSRSTGRYLVVTVAPGNSPPQLWVADTDEIARQAYRQGYTPGSAPGRYLVLAPDRIREVRALRANPEEGGKCDNPSSDGHARAGGAK